MQKQKKILENLPKKLDCSYNKFIIELKNLPDNLIQLNQFRTRLKKRQLDEIKISHPNLMIT